MKYSDAIKTDTSVRNIFAILVITIALTAYEIVLFYKVVTPTVLKQVDNRLKGFSESMSKQKINLLMALNRNEINENEMIKSIADNQMIKSIINSETTPMGNIGQDVLDTFKIREGELISKINSYTVLTGFGIIFILSIFALYAFYIIKSRNKNIGQNAWMTIIITLFLIGGFQYVFYLYGQVYKYKGGDELIYYIMTFLNKEIN